MGSDATLHVYKKDTCQYEDTVEYGRRFCFYKLVGKHHQAAYNANGDKRIPLSQACVEEICKQCKVVVKSRNKALMEKLDIDKDDAEDFLDLVKDCPPDKFVYYYDVS